MKDSCNGALFNFVEPTENGEEDSTHDAGWSRSTTPGFYQDNELTQQPTGKVQSTQVQSYLDTYVTNHSTVSYIGVTPVQPITDQMHSQSQTCNTKHDVLTRGHDISVIVIDAVLRVVQVT